MPKITLKVGELIKRLKPFGVIALKKRGKGSEVVLLLPSAQGSNKGELFTIKNHGKQTDIYVPVINSLLRRFNIDPDAFWS